MANGNITVEIATGMVVYKVLGEWFSDELKKDRGGKFSASLGFVGEGVFSYASKGSDKTGSSRPGGADLATSEPLRMYHRDRERHAEALRCTRHRCAEPRLVDDRPVTRCRGRREPARTLGQGRPAPQ